LLKVKGIEVYYGDVQILRGVDLEVSQGEVVCLLGANGSGKTTTLRSISGVLRPKVGSIEFLGERIDTVEPSRIVDMGLAHVPEGRQLFGNMTVLENLEMGAILPRAKAKRKETLEAVYHLFPRLKERHSQLAVTLSGGEQQMVAIGRALMSLPKLLALDEPSLGLAPILVKQVFNTVTEISGKGTTVLLVEQNLVESLKISNRGYVLETGKVTLKGTGQELLSDEATRKAYMGMAH
jgi:branched-chain amino acid transport system ATP-binding protein